MNELPKMPQANMETDFRPAFRAMEGLSKIFHFMLVTLIPMLILICIWDHSTNGSGWSDLFKINHSLSEILSSDTMAYFCYSLMVWRLGNVTGDPSFVYVAFLASAVTSTLESFSKMLADVLFDEDYYQLYVHRFIGKELDVLTATFFTVTVGRMVYWQARYNKLIRPMDDWREVPWYLLPFSFFARLLLFLLNDGQYLIFSIFMLQARDVDRLIRYSFNFIDKNAVLPIFCGAFCWDTLGMLMPNRVRHSRFTALATPLSCAIGIMCFTFVRVIWDQGLEDRTVNFFPQISTSVYILVESLCLYVALFGNPLNALGAQRGAIHLNNSEPEEELSQKDIGKRV